MEYMCSEPHFMQALIILINAVGATQLRLVKNAQYTPLNILYYSYIALSPQWIDVCSLEKENFT